MFDGIPSSLVSFGTISKLPLPDGREIRYAELHPSNPRGTAVSLYGKNSYIEKFPAHARALLNRGLVTYIPEMPGHGLSPRYITKGKKQRRNHLNRYDDQVYSFNYFRDNVVLPRKIDGPVIYFGHSEGCLTQATSLAEDPKKEVDAAVWENPMFDIKVRDPIREIKRIAYKLAGWEPPPSQRIERPKWGTRLTRLAVAIHLSTMYAPGEKDFNPDRLHFEDNPYTNNPVYFENNNRRLKKDPKKSTDGATMGYYVEIEKAMDRIVQDDRFGNIKAPMIILSGENDEITPTNLIELHVYLLGAEHKVVSGAKHDMPAEPRSIRREKWQYVDSFLAKHVFH